MCTENFIHGFAFLRVEEEDVFGSQAHQWLDCESLVLVYWGCVTLQAFVHSKDVFQLINITPVHGHARLKLFWGN